MNFNTEDLLEFCAYYNIAKSMARLPLNSLKIDVPQNNQIKNEETKKGRKKMEIVGTKKQDRPIKPKFQQVSKRVQKKSASPMEKFELRDAKQLHSKQYDLDYFMSHMAEDSAGKTYNQTQYRTRQYQSRPFHNKKYELPTQNHDGFAKDTVYHEFQSFDQKVRRENNKYAKSAVNNFYQPTQNYLPQYSMTQRTKPPNDNSWLYEKDTAKKSYIGQSQKVPFVPFIPYQQIKPTESRLNYSPSARSHSPVVVSATPLSTSWIKNSPNNETSLSKSSKLRKKSERPFYDASKLTLKAQNEPLRQTKQDQSLLSQSFVSAINENSVGSTMKKPMAQENKRETSNTAPSRAYSKFQQKNERLDLDDDLGDTLSELQRYPPMALQIKIKSTT